MTKTNSCRIRPSALETLPSRLDGAEKTLRTMGRGKVESHGAAGPLGDHASNVHEANHLYRNLAEQMQLGACLLSPQGTVLFTTSHLAHLLGVNPEQLTGSPWSRWVRGEDQSRLGRLLQQSLDCSVKSETELVSVTGEPRPVQLSVSLLQTEEGQNVSALVLDLRCASAPRKRCATRGRIGGTRD